MFVSEFGKVCQIRELNINVVRHKMEWCNSSEEQLEEVEEFKCLGSTVYATDKAELEMSYRVKEGLRMKGSLNQKHTNKGMFTVANFGMLEGMDLFKEGSRKECHRSNI